MHDPFEAQLKSAAYALDSTVVDLCLTLFPWAQHRRRKSAIKVHTQLDLHGSIPTFVHVSGGQIHDLAFLDELNFEPGAFYIMDKGYTDFRRLFRIHEERSFFVIRAKRNLVYTRHSSAPVVSDQGVVSDQRIRLIGPKTGQLYPDSLRRVHYIERETGRHFYYLTNNMKLAPITIARLYKSRWQVELFFRWIKQHLHIKSFFGTSENAVKTQVWIAICVYVLVAIMKRELAIERSLYEILQVLAVSLFEDLPLYQAVTAIDLELENAENPKQLWLFDF
jgi:IS4 transposase